MIASATMPTIADLLSDLAHTETLKTQHRMACVTSRGVATARMAVELSKERAVREHRLAEAAARLATIAARCEQRIAGMYAPR